MIYRGVFSALIAFSAFTITEAKAECGIASTYHEGRFTATGARYNHMGISAAHKSLPFGTRVLVRTRNGRSIIVPITDRGPFVGGRIIDLSTGAKNALGMNGLAAVCIDVVSYGELSHYRGTRHHRKLLHLANIHPSNFVHSSYKHHHHRRHIHHHLKKHHHHYTTT